MASKLLTKTQLLAFRQCEKKLWLELHHPERKTDSPFAKTSLATGNRVGEIARSLYDTKDRGNLIALEKLGVSKALEKTQTILSTATANSAQPIFEAAFSADGGLVFVDALIPIKKSGRLTWKMLEVKSSTRVKDSHRDDVAVQAYVATKAGLALQSVVIAHIDDQWSYAGGNQYEGLLTEQDFTSEAQERAPDVAEWISKSQVIAEQTSEPTITTGKHCQSPVQCGFIAHCKSQESSANFPISLLPGSGSKTFQEYLKEHQVTELSSIPDALLSARQLRVKQHTLDGTTYFDATAAKAELSKHSLPAYFLDFESIQFAVPVWKSTRPYQQIPFQFSLHNINPSGEMTHQSFLDLSGKDPSKAFAQALTEMCGESGPVFVYNAAFEASRINELAQRYPSFKVKLLSINERLVDLLKVAEKHYYHPDQKGSWSIKKVLPTIAPDLRYDTLEGVQDGGMAMTAYMEATASETSLERKQALEQQLLKYCELDTYAMVRLWQFFSCA
jgi:predicted RecB family nuclease